MHDATMQGSPRKKFNKIRELNRRRNYFTKKVRNALRVGVAKALWDRRRRQPVDLSSAKTVLLMRNEGAVGDVVVDSALVKCLHQSGYIVDFLLTTSNSQVMRYNPRIRHIYEADPVTSADFLRKFNHNVPRDVINELANNKYDIIIDPSLFDIPVHRLRLFRQIKAKSVLGFNKWPSIKHYSHSFDFDCQRWHVTKTFELIADYLQLDTRGLDAYDLAVPGPIMQEVAQYLASLSGKAVVINPFNTLHHAMALIAQAELIISPDTSVVHMAAAWNKPLIAVYKDVLLNNRLWAPGYDNARQIIVKCGKVHQHRGLVDRIIAALPETL